MKYAAYNYKTRVIFSQHIRRHYFLLRCVPSHNGYQQAVSESCAVSPLDTGYLLWGRDSFGNTVLSGGIAEPHSYFEIASGGEIKLSEPYAIFDDHPNRIYRYPSAYTCADEAVLRLLKEQRLPEGASIGETVAALASLVYGALEYVPDTTDVGTTASEALKMGKGVCQDFAHLLIALCRQAGILARYAAGFTEGEGRTHAWVEFYEGGYWKAVDPTHNCIVETGYIKLSHGRDFEDCSIERGVFSGAAEQRLEVQLSVTLREGDLSRR